MKYTARVDVTLKQGVLDAEAATVKKALKLLDFKVDGVKTIKSYEIAVDADSEENAKKACERMCETLLANPVVNEYKITVI